MAQACPFFHGDSLFPAPLPITQGEDRGWGAGLRGEQRERSHVSGTEKSWTVAWNEESGNLDFPTSLPMIWNNSSYHLMKTY